MSIISVNEFGLGDEYLTPSYVVEILLPHLKKRNYKIIWCPCDTINSEYVKVFRKEGYKVIVSHIKNGEDFLYYKPLEEFDIIITNPPFSIKNKILQRLYEIKKPFAILLSATCIQSASLIRLLEKFEDFNFIMFDKRISFNGDRPPFPSWYFTSKLLNNNEFYLYQDNPKKLYSEWFNNKN